MLEEVWVQKRNEKLFCILLVITLLALASQNWMLGLLAAILDLGCLLFIKKRDMDQEKILMKYLDDLSAGVEAGTVYAVKNLPLGIAMINENGMSSGRTAYSVRGRNPRGAMKRKSTGSCRARMPRASGGNRAGSTAN